MVKEDREYGILFYVLCAVVGVLVVMFAIQIGENNNGFVEKRLCLQNNMTQQNTCSFLNMTQTGITCWKCPDGYTRALGHKNFTWIEEQGLTGMQDVDCEFFVPECAQWAVVYCQADNEDCVGSNNFVE